MSDLFTAKQRLIWDFDQENQPRITILEGAVRSGKSYVNNFLWMAHVQQYRNHGVRFIMTGATIASLQRNVLDDLSIFGVRAELNKRNEFKMFGNTVACFGADKVDSYRAMKGFTSYGWYANEITEHHINSVAQAQNRCSGPGARIFWDTNPAGPSHPIKVNYIDHDGQKLSDGRINIKSWHFSLDDNTHLEPAYIESLKLTTPTGMWFDRDILGLWVAAEGMIYRDFDYGKHVLDVTPEGFKEYFAGVDWGFEHAGVIGLYGRDGDGNCVRIKEVVQNGQSVEWWAQVALDMQRDYGRITFYCDPARPDNISYFNSRGLWARPADNEVVEGITFVAEQFRLNHLYIVRDTNRNYLLEIYNYRWKKNATKEEPIKEDDHSMDSERYALYSHIGKRRQIRATLSLYR